MPSVSTKQHDAMEAAAHGKSTLGIPKKVGEEFVAADKAKPKGGNASTNAQHKSRGAKWYDGK